RALGAGEGLPLYIASFVKRARPSRTTLFPYTTLFRSHHPETEIRRARIGVVSDGQNISPIGGELLLKIRVEVIIAVQLLILRVKQGEAHGRTPVTYAPRIQSPPATAR